MITGFNTDIEYAGVTYHVQTEDKGLNTPLILSLVYDRGTILASKRSPYDDLIAAGFDEKELAGRLQKQHKLICAAVRGGRIEDLKRMTMKESANAKKGLIAQREAKPVKEEKPPEIVVPKPEIPLPSVLKAKPPVVEETKPAITKTAEPVWDIPLTIIEADIIETAPDIEEEIILPAEAVEIITDLGNQIVDDKLSIELLNDTNFKSGDRQAVSILVRRGNAETGLSGAHILVKIVGSSFRPLIFHSKTDSNGIAVVHLQIPQFKVGRGAILIKAMSEGEETELRRTINHG